MGDSTVLTQDVQPADGEVVSGDAALQNSAPTCCGRVYLINSKRNGEYRRYECRKCGKRVSIGSKGRGRPRKKKD
jgi:hypothetical protein